MTLFARFRQAFGGLAGHGAKRSDRPGQRAKIPRDPHDDGRYCRTLLARPSAEELAANWKRLEANMALVPGGVTRLAPAVPRLAATDDPPLDPGVPVAVEAFYLDRYATTNEQFGRFVDDGGYSEPQLWPAEALTHLLQFVDRTGCPGPKFWSEGRPPAAKADHPVVGICWYEADAFARWAGKQLPTAAQWQRAGGWSQESGGHAQAKYPWGNVFDPQRANTWTSGIRDTVPANQYYNGSTPNGVYQLIGNVWEWVAGSFDEAAGGNVLFEQPMGEIRGGAYDTYLETQATCQFRSCQPLLYRGANIGFRGCLAAKDLPLPPDPSAFV